MFTGLIETTGTVLAVEQREGSRRIAIAAPGMSAAHRRQHRGQRRVPDRAGYRARTRFHADLAAETVARTSLSLLAPGSTVNLELPTPAGAPLGGHVVQGHVDGTGTLLSLEPVDAARRSRTRRLVAPGGRARQRKPLHGREGSIAIEGISLTIARWEPGTAEGDVVSVAIIPHTYARTNLHTLKAGQPVNIEADVLIKFMEQRALRNRSSI